MDVKSDLTSEYISRLLNYMDKHNYKALQSKVIETNLKRSTTQSELYNRASNMLPKEIKPWRVYQNIFWTISCYV
jgi:hypothetical protein